MNLIKKEILITKDCFLVDIQNTFAAFFPFLKIDFFQPDTLSKMSRSSRIDLKTSLKNFGGIPKKINVDNNRSVSELCNDFKNALGFVVEVSRKSGNVWNVISVTEGWTLEDQNAAGEYISSVMDVPTAKKLIR